MRLEQVDLNLFVIMDALYRERKVTRVAAQLNLTQPAISNALNRLRQTFDDKLFVRTPGGMKPTPVADSIIHDVRQALLLLGNSINVNMQFDPMHSEKEFHLGMNDFAESIISPKLSEKIRALAPNIHLTSSYIDRQTATEELKSGNLDLLLDAHIVNAKDLEQSFLGKLPYVVTMSPEHEFANQELDLEAYLSSSHLHVSSRSKGRGQVDIALHTLGKRRRIALRLHSYLVAARVMEKSDLLWTAPKVIAETTSLCIKPLPFDVEYLPWNIFWHGESTNDPANIWLREIVTEVGRDVLSVDL